jgi:Zn-dependent M28 family amino/carboxypeptidase
MMHRPTVVIPVALAAGALGGCGDDGHAAPPRAAPAAPPAAARASAGLGDHLRALQRIASSHGGNRAAGTPGYDASVAYVERELRAAGLRVRTQAVPFAFFAEAAPPRVTRIDGPDRRMRPGRDVLTLQFSGSGTLAGDVRPIEVRPGSASASGCARGAFARLRRAEIALVQRGTCTLRRKALNAQAAGAAAVLILNDGRRGRTGTFAGSLQGPGVRIPALALSTAAGAELARSRRPRLRLAVRTTSENRTTRNVIAETGARSPTRIVMAGAHLDSVPAGPGVNDNGSGVTALLDVAASVAGRRLAPGTQLQFAFWGAEELGLFGSRRYVSRLNSAARRRHAAYLNLDMVGTPHGTRGVYRGVDAPSRRIERLLRRALGGRITPERLGGASDHAPFASAGIPVGGFFTGLDRCYHRRCDRLGNVDTRLLAEMTRAARSALLALARG